MCTGTKLALGGYVGRHKFLELSLGNPNQLWDRTRECFCGHPILVPSTQYRPANHLSSLHIELGESPDHLIILKRTQHAHPERMEQTQIAGLSSHRPTAELVQKRAWWMWFVL